MFQLQLWNSIQLSFNYNFFFFQNAKILFGKLLCYTESKTLYFNDLHIGLKNLNFFELLIPFLVLSVYSFCVVHVLQSITIISNAKGQTHQRQVLSLHICIPGTQMRNKATQIRIRSTYKLGNRNQKTQDHIGNEDVQITPQEK